MSVFSTVQNILPIILIIVLGYILQKLNWFNDEFPHNISRLILSIALPSAILTAVMSHISMEELVNLSGMLLFSMVAFALTYLVGFLTTKLFRVRAGRRGVMINAFINANTLFIGLPLNLALFGSEAMPYFLIYYLTNTVSTWTLGFYLISIDPLGATTDNIKKPFQWNKLLSPPLLAFVVAFILLSFSLEVPLFLQHTFQYIGNLVTPLALIYIGISLAKTDVKAIKIDRDTLISLIGRFIVAPLIMYAVIQIVDPNLPSIQVKTLIVQSAGPSLAVLPILADQGKGDVIFANNIVTFSTLIFVIVIPCLLFILGS